MLVEKRARSDEPHGASCHPYSASSSQGHTLTEATPMEQGRDAAGKAGTGLSHGAGEARPCGLHAACSVQLLQAPCGPRVHGSQPRQLRHPWQEHNLVGGRRVVGRGHRAQPHSPMPTTVPYIGPHNPFPPLPFSLLSFSPSSLTVPIYSRTCHLSLRISAAASS